MAPLEHMLQLLSGTPPKRVSDCRDVCQWPVPRKRKLTTRWPRERKQHDFFSSRILRPKHRKMKKPRPTRETGTLNFGNRRISCPVVIGDADEHTRMFFERGDDRPD